MERDSYCRINARTMKIVPWWRRLENSCNSSSWQLLLCVRVHREPDKAHSFTCPVYSYRELGRSYLAGRVLCVMAKLPSWHCPIKTYSTCLFLKNSHHTAGLHGHSHPAQAIAEGTEHAWQAARGTAQKKQQPWQHKEAAFQHTHLHNTSRHAHQPSCRASVMIPNTHKAGVS